MILNENLTVNFIGTFTKKETDRIEKFVLREFSGKETEGLSKLIAEYTFGRDFKFNFHSKEIIEVMRTK